MVAEKTDSWTATNGHNGFPALPKASSLEDCHYLICLVAFEKAPFTELILIWSGSEHTQCKQLYLQDIRQKQTLAIV